MSNIQVPPPSDPELPKWLGDNKAKAEEKNWDKEGKLKGQEEHNYLLWLKVYGAVVIMLLSVFALLFLASVASWSLHYLLPASWHWLNDEQLSKIQSILFSGSIGGVVSLVAKKQLSK